MKRFDGMRDRYKDICVRLDNADCSEICTDSEFGFEKNSEFIIFNFKKEHVQKIEVIFKSQLDRDQIAIGDLQIFYTERYAVNDVIAPACVEAQIIEEDFDQINIKVRIYTIAITKSGRNPGRTEIHDVRW